MLNLINNILQKGEVFMNTFDNLVQVDIDGAIVYNQWIEWDHFLVPNKPDWLRDLIRNVIALFGHCMTCSALDGCYLITNKTPNNPLHENCDCKKIDINFNKVKINASADCDIRKFTEYVFANTQASKGKNKIFYDLGFDISDSKYLQAEFCRQAKFQYLSGKYILKNLDRRGQRLAIPITIKNVNFYSGWLLYPEGKIKNTTPFGGWIK